ncbi:tyrosine-type recombinase/integrase [Levilactobacillus lanxiensis]|uniref:Tyrosine-type recombinase/integrase n=1 Tax=Levilactobacillus lanxiensis TaxID=2799568 RepID=A0ABW4D570_9LACO|nr:site-specific integrase [Levilactobacillus lanxiensis]
MKITSRKTKGKTVFDLVGYLGTYTDVYGQEQSKTFHRRGFESRKEALLAFSHAQSAFDRDKKKGIQVKERPKFTDVYTMWFETYRLGVKESTLNRVEGIFKHHILPSLGNKYMDEITWQMCQKAVLDWRNVVKQFNKLAQYAALVFRTAQKMGVIVSNPMKLVDVPEPVNSLANDDEPLNYWSSSELATFLRKVDRNDQKEARFDRGALFYLIATTGMRKGEALALTWGDLNLREGFVTIDKTTTRTEHGTQTIGTPKTRNAYRTLALDPVTINHLKKYRSSLAVIPLASHRIFLSSRTGKAMSLMTPNHWMDRIIEQINSERSKTHETPLRRITVHGLRHTFASIQVQHQINVKALQLQLGHSDIKITLNIYAHMSAHKIAENVYRISDII